jgi:cyclopropane fatty-acyl-phospholipid synthase-like methyltransferase
VLDIGVAYGIWSMMACDAKANVKAIDISKWWCDKFKEITEYKGYNIPIQNINILDLKTTDKYDIVLLIAVLHHVERWAELLDKVFSLSNDIIYLECPVGEKITDKKHKSFGEREEQSWYYVPNIKELIIQIEKRGGKITNGKFNTKGNRYFCEIKINHE